MKSIASLPQASLSPSLRENVVMSACGGAVIVTLRITGILVGVAGIILAGLLCWIANISGSARGTGGTTPQHMLALAGLLVLVGVAAVLSPPQPPGRYKRPH